MPKIDKAAMLGIVLGLILSVPVVIGLAIYFKI
jgi:hypothetical protein